ncbi:MAG TPA: glycerol-3-phosphate acyltransferase [Bacillota bacterium]|nr:glycerol-3-phosphate acyltransferase [Bacillota bacterium]HOA14724.1 glycerol-3-phosphate acyltransferase [Bacillota bacterium]HOG53066.1 glycerol-3-phosphate acyltransferase [Bacillota bacterium]
MPAVEFLIKALAAFLVGSIPFAYIAVKAFGSKDIRQVGEGNPGTANAFRACGAKVGIPVLVLDSMKGLITVLSLVAGASYWQRPALAIMPVLGHAFSPWLGFRGGKAITTSFGIWTALTVWGAPVAMGAGAIFAQFAMKGRSDLVKVVPIIASLGLYLLISRRGPDMWVLFIANSAVLFIKQAQYSAAGTGSKKP